jgi:hypothetical protein
LSLASPKFDVAISFLSQDEALAAALDRQLSESLNVFFFPRKQEDLAGTDGMESMRTPFLDDSRVMVVLYRELWGKTRWTAIEETAVKDACFNGGWKRLFFIALDRTSPLPTWLPEYYVRYNWEDFGMEQAVGVIKARVLDNGGTPVAMTAVKKAQLLQQDDEFRWAEQELRSQSGLPRILDSVKVLFAQMESECAEINDQGHLRIEYESTLQDHANNLSCILTDNRVGLAVHWHQPFLNSPESSVLLVRQFNGRLMLPREMKTGTYYLTQPKLMKEQKYRPALSRARECGWKPEPGKEDFISSPRLASSALLVFLDLVEKAATGKLTRDWV